MVWASPDLPITTVIIEVSVCSGEGFWTPTLNADG
jgi:hypothetical protein